MKPTSLLSPSPARCLRRMAAVLVLAAGCQAAAAQTASPDAAAAPGNPASGGSPSTAVTGTLPAAPEANAPAAASSAASGKLDQLGWLSGCWRGEVNQRVFREEWLPLAGGMLVGAGQVVMQGRTQDYQYLRLEPRGDDLYYVIVPGRGAPLEFALASVTRDEANAATIFTFQRAEASYPQRIVYRRGEEGWLYASVEGEFNGKDRNVIYPMRRVDCETGELIKH